MNELNSHSCRACLVADVKLYNLFTTGLAELFGYLSKTPVTHSEDLPQYVCYYCQAQLLKFQRFQDRCQQSYVYLKENVQKVSSTSIPLHRSKSLALEYLPEQNNSTNNDLTNDYKVYTQHGEFTNNFSNTENNLSNTKNENDDLIDFYDEDDKKSCNEESIAFIDSKIKNELFDDDEDIIPLKDLKIESGTYGEIKKLEDILNIRKVQERKESKEYKESRFSCNVCYKGFMSETAHKRHMKSHDPSSGAFVCQVCHMRYPTQRNLNTHARQHKKIFACVLCEQVNVDTTRAKLHSRWHKGVKFPCKLCDKEFKKRRMKTDRRTMDFKHCKIDVNVVTLKKLTRSSRINTTAQTFLPSLDSVIYIVHDIKTTSNWLAGDPTPMLDIIF
ncbi:zinc-finger associated domain (zf-AD) domain-containing protein [Phthorimaea operculella]|nr:zinc-finger associated domain (zf-AD) domain-containing protein [Phthorimaea operculella]